ncbi:MAG: hypothetical protein KC912_11355 [Proteobacteria bacterium]|nr:hypothetical protein [Pseudomonadota bacterium]
MRALGFVPFLVVLMGSDCNGNSEDPVDTTPPVNSIEVTLAGSQTTLASGQSALSIDWSPREDLSFQGFADDPGGLTSAWLTVSDVDFVAGSPSVTGSGTTLTVSGTPELPLSAPTQFVVEMHSRAADGVETHGPQVLVSVTECTGTTVISMDSGLCSDFEGRISCDLSADACYGETVAVVSNEGSTSVTLFAEGGPGAPSAPLTVQPGQVSGAWNGGSGIRGVGVDSASRDFRAIINWM